MYYVHMPCISKRGHKIRRKSVYILVQNSHRRHLYILNINNLLIIVRSVVDFAQERREERIGDWHASDSLLHKFVLEKCEHPTPAAVLQLWAHRACHRVPARVPCG